MDSVKDGLGKLRRRDLSAIEEVPGTVGGQVQYVRMVHVASNPWAIVVVGNWKGLPLPSRLDVFDQLDGLLQLGGYPDIYLRPRQSKIVAVEIHILGPVRFK